jgi:ABC-2 type transport system ATP-binding protein
MTEAIEVLHPRKTYGATVAVDDVSFSVAEGEIFGILGPNGAGKTTAVECVIGLRSPTRASSGSSGPSPGPRGPARDRGGMGNLFR